MQKAIIEQIADVLFTRGLRSHDVALSAAGILAAWHETRGGGSARALFAQLSNRLQGHAQHDGLTAAADWLEDPGLPAMQWEALDAGLERLRKLSPGPIDWSAELTACLAQDRSMQFGLNLPLPLARAVSRLIDVPISDTCVCLFDGATTLAWTLSGDRPVTLFASEQYQAIVVAIMARAACRSLTVDIRNPINGSYLAAQSMRDEPDRNPPFAEADHIISVPPIGMRVSDGPSKGASFEAYQIEKLKGRAKKSFCTLVGDGILFRESRHEVDLRRRTVEEHATTVVSLPSGMFWPAPGLPINLVQLKPLPQGQTRLINGRSIEKTGSGRAQEGLIVRHLDQFHGLRPHDTTKCAVITLDELAGANYVLLPERYLKSEELAHIEDAIQELPQISLEQIALIERSKAPIPLRDADGQAEINALEIAPSDVVDGIVRTPKKLQAFGKDQEAAVARVTVRHGDILVSIKGNVGIIGIVGLDAFLSEALDEPWIISQSLAIIRWQPNPYIPSPEILNAVLTAPWVREKLESMSGGGTVRTLPMSAVRSFRLPVPTAEDCAVAAGELELLGEMRQDIETRTQNLAQAKNALWHKLWHLPPEIGED